MSAIGRPLLEVKGLRMHFPITEGLVARRLVGEVKAVDGIDFSVHRGETLGGELRVSGALEDFADDVTRLQIVGRRLADFLQQL